MKVDIIFPYLPPMLNGIGDYTAIVAAELAKRADVRILAGQGTFDPIPGVDVVNAYSVADRKSMMNISDLVEVRRPDWVLLQYNPFSYGRWGFNPKLPNAMRSIKLRSPGTQIATMVHEPFVRVESWQFAIMTTWQRRQLWRLGQCSDRLLFSIDAWMREFQRWFPNRQVSHLPVMSNIPDAGLTREEARLRLGIGPNDFVIGIFGTFHISSMVDRLRRAAVAAQEAGKEVIVLYIGPKPEVVHSAIGSIRTIADGHLSSDEVSRRLSAIDIFVSAFVDGVSTRRGSFMAAIQHGLAIVGTDGHLTDPILREANNRAYCLAPVESASQFDQYVERLTQDDALRVTLGTAARRLYLDNFSRECIGAQLFEILSGCALTGVAS